VSGGCLTLGGCRLRVDTVEKGFWEGLPSNIDSKPASDAQYRFKKLAALIRLLRVGGMLRTFSTVSVMNGKPQNEQIFSGSPRKQTSRLISAESTDWQRTP